MPEYVDYSSLDLSKSIGPRTVGYIDALNHIATRIKLKRDAIHADFLTSAFPSLRLQAKIDVLDEVLTEIKTEKESA